MFASSRREFVSMLGAAGLLGALPRTLSGAASNEGTIFKSVKWGMIQTGSNTLEKFQLQKELGFDGIELVSPTAVTAEDVRIAHAQTGMPVHGVVDMVHWDKRLSSPDAVTREEGRRALEQAIIDCSDFGGFSVLLVPGKVTGPDEDHDDVWQRSIVEIRKVLPLAAHRGVRILIENVWNGFCEEPEQLRDYLDEISSPWVGAYFDIGNHQKFGGAVRWIKVLGSRIVKLDVKDWGVSNGFCKIGDGDVDWEGVRKELAAIDFSGWCTAEVQGGGVARLREIAAGMDRVLAL